MIRYDKDWTEYRICDAVLLVLFHCWFCGSDGVCRYYIPLLPEPHNHILRSVYLSMIPQCLGRRITNKLTRGGIAVSSRCLCETCCMTVEQCKGQQLKQADSERDSMDPGELEYGSILPNGDDWRLRKFDTGMGETEYRIFRNGIFFAQFDNRLDAEIVMTMMIHQSECDFAGELVTAFTKGHIAGAKSGRDKVLDEFRIKYVEFLTHPCPELADKYEHCCDVEWCGLCTFDEVLEELRQKVGE